MTTWTLQAPMPELTLPGGTQIVFEAISPTTGAAVGGVTVSAVALFGTDLSAEVGALEDVEPFYTPEEVGSEA